MVVEALGGGIEEKKASFIYVVFLGDSIFVTEMGGLCPTMDGDTRDEDRQKRRKITMREIVRSKKMLKTSCSPGKRAQN